MVVVPKPLGLAHDLVDASGGYGSGGGGAGDYRVSCDKCLGRRRGVVCVARGGRQAVDEGWVLVLEEFVSGCVGVAVHLLDGAEWVEAVVAFVGFLPSVLAVAAGPWAVADFVLVDGACGAFGLVLFRSVAAATAAAADKSWVACAAVGGVAEFVASVALSEDGARVEATCFALDAEHPERALEEGGYHLILGVEDGD
jgi:hypothetical protein